MCRRAVTLLLVPTILFTQWAGLCRCVGGCETDPENTPHVHLNVLIPGFPDEPGCGCRRHHQDPTAPQNGCNETEPAAVIGAAPSDPSPAPGSHDPIIYISPDAGHGLPANVASGDGGVGNDSEIGVNGPAPWSAPSHSRLVLRGDLQPRPTHPCPVYLLTRSLLL